jgi:hypothetical protein
MPGTGFVAEQNPRLQQFLHWPGGHLILLKTTPEFLILYVAFFEQQTASILVSSEPEHWSNLGKNDGIVYVVSPGLRKYVGPITFSAFVAHKMGVQPNPALSALVQEEQEHPLPPFVV